MHSHAVNRHLRTGFTLVELMIAVAVTAILAALAWPALTEAVQKSRRADGMAALASIMQAQERWRSNNPAYQATLADLPGAQASVSPEQHYDLVLVDGSVTANTYTAQATVRESSPQHSDGRCQTLQVAVNGVNIVYTSQPGAGEGAPDPCWIR